MSTETLYLICQSITFQLCNSIFFLPNSKRIPKKDMKKFCTEHCNNLGVNNLLSHYGLYTLFPNKQFMHFVDITQMKGQRTWYLDP